VVQVDVLSGGELARLSIGKFTLMLQGSFAMLDDVKGL